MIPHSLLSNLHHQHELLASLVESLPDEDCNRRYREDLASVAWYFGRAVYLELYWLRETVAGDADLAARVRPIFAGATPDASGLAALPPRDHLLNWGLEVFDQDLTRLANPAESHSHPLLEGGWILGYLAQVMSQYYEKMVQVLVERRLAEDCSGYAVQAPLVPALPAADAAAIDQGHYRVGARGGTVFDNELPPMSVELHNFRIQRQPVSNAEFLAFLVDGGYESPRWWTEEGDAWRRTDATGHPYHWRRDGAGRWFGVGVGGAADLVADDPLHGINRHEAEAFAAWAAEHGEGLTGAVLQHEFQWEVAARAGHLSSVGRVWEWCNNLFEPYDAYSAPDDPERVTREFDGRHWSIRGAALHTQPPIRRASYRGRALPTVRHSATGLRLVLPPA